MVAATHRLRFPDRRVLHSGQDGVADGPAAGGTAITRHALVDGRAWYVSTRLDVDGLAGVLRPAYDDAGLTPTALPDEVEVVRREGAGADYVVVVNHDDRKVTVPMAGTDLLIGKGRRGSTRSRPPGRRGAQRTVTQEQDAEAATSRSARTAHDRGSVKRLWLASSAASRRPLPPALPHAR